MNNLLIIANNKHMIHETVTFKTDNHTVEPWCSQIQTVQHKQIQKTVQHKQIQTKLSNW